MWEEIRVEVIWSPLKKLQRLQVEITFKNVIHWVIRAPGPQGSGSWFVIFPMKQWIILEFPQGSLQNPTVDTQLATLESSAGIQSLNRYKESILKLVCKSKGTLLMGSTHLNRVMHCFGLHMKHCKPVPQKSDFYEVAKLAKVWESVFLFLIELIFSFSKDTLHW